MTGRRATDDALLVATDLSRTYGLGDTSVAALSSVDLTVSAGSFVVVKGRSGSGKTTLLNLLGGLDRPTSGSVALDGRVLAELDDNDLLDVRRNQIGFVFQSFGLLPILTAAENVEVPLRMLNTAVDERAARCRELLAMVGLADRALHRPDELSGGEQQRVAIARALANRPELIIADEPTGQLDSRTGGEIITLIHDLVRNEGVAAVVATHDPQQLALADEIVELHDGRRTSNAEP